MSIHIDSDLCVSCGACVEICPGSLLARRAADGKAVVRYPKDCWGCASCLKVCPARAIRFHLGADVGGRGGSFHIERSTHWVYTSPTGSRTEIFVNPQASNDY